MNIAEVSIRKKTVTLVLTTVAVVGGLFAYTKLGRLEDPEFTIKEAMIITPYPGATAGEVEKEVTNEIEKSIQEMGQLKRVESRSSHGLSMINVVIQDKYKRDQLPQVWDEMRRKVISAQANLPPGVSTQIINDDYGDVYGVYVAVTGDGYTYREIRDYVNMLRRELLLVKDVKRIDLWGLQPEAIYVEMRRDRMARLGISREQIYDALAAKNLVVDAGRVKVGAEFLSIEPTGEFVSEKQFADLLISEPGAAQLIYLGDVADIKRGYVDPPDRLLRVSSKRVLRDGRLLAGEDFEKINWDDKSLDVVVENGLPAIGLAISTAKGGNVVDMGEALAKRFKELEARRPVGMELHAIAIQSDAVTKAINGFMVNLAEAIAIVIIVLLLFMGIKSGFLIGFILLLTICASFLVMKTQGILLERISLGALIIALGMLVDNAIVVTEGVKVQIESGVEKLKAARDVVTQNQWPLLGATFVAIIAFAVIGTSDHNTGDYCKSLFQVLLISLLMSWLTAVTVTPLLCYMAFKPLPTTGGGPADPYAGKVFTIYRNFLEWAIRRRVLSILAVVAMFCLAVYGFGFLPQSFFPDSDRPQLMVDVWMPAGFHIRETEKAVAPIEDYVMSLDNTQSVATHVGAGGSRFLLVYSPEKPDSGYAQLLVSVYDSSRIPEMMADIEAWITANVPDALAFGKAFRLGPGGGGAIQLRISGPDPRVLRSLADEATAIMYDDPVTKYVRNDWRNRVKVIRPVLLEAQARRTGITRRDVAQALAASFEGQTVGVYREGTSDQEDRLIPIISRPPADERMNVDNIRDLLIRSPAANRMIPLRQIVERFDTTYEDPFIQRRNRTATIKLHADQKYGEASVLWNRVAPKVDAMFAAKRASGEIPSDYDMVWGGEYEDSGDAKAAIGAYIPVFLIAMVLIVIALFNSLRQPLIIWLTVPLALIGVSAGLSLFKQPFNFMAILGALSLSGMLIKNAIVLIDQINLNLAEGRPPYDAVVESGVSRMRPVMMAAATTVLGMLPLLTDKFFVSMAITIMFGLAFATVLTLVFVPVLYVTFYRIRARAG